MAIFQSRSKRKPTGGANKSTFAKRKHSIGRLPTLTKLGDTKAKDVKTKGGSQKMRLLATDTANVVDPKTGKTAKSKIKNVVENPANRYYVRRNIITQGTIIETDKGRAKVTSRPGQEGTVNAVLI